MWLSAAALYDGIYQTFYQNRYSLSPKILQVKIVILGNNLSFNHSDNSHRSCVQLAVLPLDSTTNSIVVVDNVYVVIDNRFDISYFAEGCELRSFKNS